MTTADSASGQRALRALASLRGLSVGDALGSQFFVPVNYPLLKQRELPPGSWQWTDDTEMACSVLAVLVEHERIDQDALAHSFADHHDFDRGYGPAVNRLLRLVREGGDWRELASALFQGQGSWGNGSAMRIAPLGAWYADDPEQATHQAEISSYTTHQHREAVVGAMAVAAAASLAAATTGPPTPAELLDGVIALVPRSAVGAGLRRARDMLDYGDAGTVAAVLGNGRMYQRTRHRSIRPLVGGAEPGRLRAGLLGDRPGGRGRRHDVCDRRRDRRGGQGGRATGRLDGADGGASGLAPAAGRRQLSRRRAERRTRPPDCHGTATAPSRTARDSERKLLFRPRRR